MAYELKVPKLAEEVVRFIEKKSKISLILGLLCFFSLVPFLVKTKTDFSYTGFFYDDDPMIKDFNNFQKKFGNDDSVVIAINSPSGIFDQDSIKLLQEMTRKMWLLPEVIRVDSLTNYNWVHAEGDDIIVEPLIPEEESFNPSFLKERKEIALGHEILPDYLISRDGKTAMLFARLKPGLKKAPDFKKTIDETKKLLKNSKRTDHRLYLTGGPAITYGFEEATKIDLSKMLPLVFIATIIFLYLTLKTVWGILLSFLVIGLTVGSTFSVGALLGLPITSGTAAVPQILIGIGIADSVHILAVFYRAIYDGQEKIKAAKYSLLKNFVPTVLTTISTAIGFFSFSNVNIKSISGMGTLAGIGVLFAWAYTYFVLGGLIFLLPVPAKKWTEDKKNRLNQLIDRYMVFLEKKRLIFIYSFIALSFLGIFLSLKNTVNSDPYLYFKKGYWVREAQDFITKKVGGARGLEIMIRTGKPEGIKEPAFLKKVEKFQNWIQERPYVTRALSIIDVLKSTHRSLHGGNQKEYRLVEDKKAIAQELFLYTMSLPQGMDLNDRMTINKESMRITALWTLSKSSMVVEAVKEIENKARSMGLDITTTGKNKLYQFLNGYVVRSFVQSISVALICISLLLFLYFRSLKIGVLALMTNTIPLILGGAVLYITGRPMDVGTVIVASVCLGIAVDDTIHILSNYKRLKEQGQTSFESVRSIFIYTSPALMMTTLVLVVSFGTLAFGTFIPNVYFGVMTSIILSTALILDLTFLPAILIPKRAANGSS